MTKNSKFYPDLFCLPIHTPLRDFISPTDLKYYPYTDGSQIYFFNMISFLSSEL